ncbi:MAG: biotin--[acetyl-CoA-carboxylase] ligase [Actinobacteria bacterium]|nr:biotin--[acetyl-CoA-carboxylase] ligase [Actinomycetota bacterium]
MASDLSDEILERALVGRFGRYRRVYDSIDSTNLEALRWAAEQGAAEGSLVVADSQTAGRGRWGRMWLAQPGAGLMFSVVLRPEAPMHPGLITAAGGLAVAGALERTTGLRAAIKWPNDVIINERKVSGVLVETRSVGHAMNAVVLGAGINLHWRSSDLPAEIAESATSIAQELELSGRGRVPPRAELLAAVLGDLEGLYEDLGSRSGRVRIIERATARSSILGGEVTVRFADGSSISGVAASLGHDGALVLDDGTVVDSGEILRIRPIV